MINKTEYDVQPNTCSVGDIIVIHGPNSDRPCIIAQTKANWLQAICLESGNRWADAVMVKNPLRIHHDEVLAITNGCEFSKIARITISGEEK
jgi:hypothetical protein